MATHDISSDRWTAFFEEFSSRRQGALITVETIAPQEEPKTEIHALPLVGISLDTKGSGANSIELLLGTEASDHITHSIMHPTQVFHKTGPGILSDEVNTEEIIEITAKGNPPITRLLIHPLV